MTKPKAYAMASSIAVGGPVKAHAVVNVSTSSASEAPSASSAVSPVQAAPLGNQRNHLERRLPT